jgi:hypothetical protein
MGYTPQRSGGIVWTTGISLLLLTGGNSGCAKACTLIGCVDQASIHVHDENFTSSPLNVALTMDGQPVTCVAESSSQEITCDEQHVTVTLHELSDCSVIHERNAEAEKCVPNGKFEHVILIEGAPRQVDVVVGNTDGVSVQRTFQMEYETWFPNGPECDETPCRTTSVEWKL